VNPRRRTVGIIVDREMREKSLDMVEGGDLGRL
jgi:hypothetical protein